MKTHGDKGTDILPVLIKELEIVAILLVYSMMYTS